MPMPHTPARIDRRLAVKRSSTIDLAADLVVVTRLGIVLVGRQAGWTWYRWVLAGELWSVTVERDRTPAQAIREATRLLRRARYPRQTSRPRPLKPPRMPQERRSASGDTGVA